MDESKNTQDPGVARKKRIRAGHKSHLTKLLTSADTLLQSYSSVQEGELRALGKSLERKMQVIAKLDEELLEIVRDEEIDAEIEEADRVYGTTQEKLQDIQKRLQPKVKQEGSMGSRGTSEPVNF